MRVTTRGGTSFVDRVTVEVGDDTCEAVATPLEGEEHKRYWAILKELYPFFADHEATAGGRTIPVVALTRAQGPPWLAGWRMVPPIALPTDSAAAMWCVAGCSAVT